MVVRFCERCVCQRGVYVLIENEFGLIVPYVSFAEWSVDYDRVGRIFGFRCGVCGYEFTGFDYPKHFAEILCDDCGINFIGERVRMGKKVMYHPFLLICKSCTQDRKECCSDIYMLKMIDEGIVKLYDFYNKRIVVDKRMFSEHGLKVIKDILAGKYGMVKTD